MDLLETSTSDELRLIVDRLKARLKAVTAVLEEIEREPILQSNGEEVKIKCIRARIRISER